MLNNNKAHLIVFSVILLSGSLYYSTYYKNWLLAPFLLFLLIQSFINKNNINLSLNRVLFSILIVTYSLLNINAQTSSLIVLIICILCSILISGLIDFNQFSEIYIKIIKVFCITSWLYIVPLKLELHSFLPDFYNLVDLKYSNFIFFGIMRPDYPEGFDNIYYTSRNSGLFWEPGAYQIFINLAFYFQILNRSNSIKNIIIFGITILTCSSTMGIAVYALLLIVYIIENNLLNLKILIIFTSLIIVGISLNKDHIKKFEVGSNQHASTKSRYMDILLDKSLMENNLILGIGYSNLKERENEGYKIFKDDYDGELKPTGSNGITLLIAYLGVIIAPIIIFFLIRPTIHQEFNIASKFLLVFSCIGMFSNQNMFTYILPWLLIIYGIDRIKS